MDTGNRARFLARDQNIAPTMSMMPASAATRVGRSYPQVGTETFARSLLNLSFGVEEIDGDDAGVGGVGGDYGRAKLFAGRNRNLCPEPFRIHDVAPTTTAARFVSEELH